MSKWKSKQMCDIQMSVLFIWNHLERWIRFRSSFARERSHSQFNCDFFSSALFALLCFSLVCLLFPCINALQATKSRALMSTFFLRFKPNLREDFLQTEGYSILRIQKVGRRSEKNLNKRIYTQWSTTAHRTIYIAMTVQLYSANGRENDDRN